MHLFRLGTSLKFHDGSNQALAFASIHEQSFLLPHYCGLGSPQSVISVPQNQFLPSCCIQICPWYAGLTSVIIMEGHPCWNSAPSLYPHVSCSELQREMFCSLKRKHTSYFLTGPSFHCNCDGTSAISWTACDWLLHHVLRVTPTTSAACCGKIMCLIDAEVIGWEILFIDPSVCIWVVHLSDTVCW